MTRSIKRDFHLLSLFTIILSMVLLSGFWIYYDYRSFEIESERIRSKNLAEYRDMLQYQVNRVVNDIKYQQSTAEQLLKKSLQSRGMLGIKLAEGIMSQYQETVEQHFTETLIETSLSTLKFNNNSNQLFIIKEQGKSEQQELNTRENKPETTNLFPNINPFINKILAVMQNQDEAFLRNVGARKNGGQETTILTYATHLSEFNWIICASESLDDFTAQVQKEVIDRTELIRFGKDEKEYIFITNYDGVSMTFPAKGKNMLEVKDSNGKFIVKELINKAKAGGGFVQYVMPTLGGLEAKPKLSYAAPIPEWQWYVGAGVYIDEIDKIIEQNRQIFRQKVNQHISIMLIVVGALLVLHYLIASLISHLVWKQIELFSSFFKNAHTNSIFIETNRLDYKEFKEISRHANEMLKERNNILQEIRLSRDEWINTFNAIGDCILILDQNGIIEKANESAGDFFSVPSSELVGKPFDEICTYEHSVNQSLKDHAPHTLEVEIKDRDLIMLSSSFPLFNEDRKLSRVIVIAHDITEQKRLEAQLLHAQKMEAIGTLAGGIAHDFNNILSAILGYTELAQIDLQKKQPIDNYLEQVLQAGFRARNLVKQILMFSRQAKTTKTIIEPKFIIEEALLLLRSSLPTTIHISQTLGKNCGKVFMDPTQLHQIVMNLCTNAFHAMEEKGGTLSISLRQQYLDANILKKHIGLTPGDYIELIVEDQGCGIAPGIKSKIFDPFFTTKDLGKGTGMGLSIVHGIIKDCKGFITCNSKLGKGTIFSINLPVLTQNVGVSHKTEPKVIITGEKHILVVDDEKMIVEILEQILKQSGFIVHPYTSGTEALIYFEKNSKLFDLVITDQTMPDITGIELSRRMLRMRPDLPIILCTGYSSTISSEDVYKAGIRGFALKPLTKNEIYQIIKRVLYETNTYHA